jgi:hypothetical protein
VGPDGNGVRGEARRPRAALPATARWRASGGDAVPSLSERNNADGPTPPPPHGRGGFETLYCVGPARGSSSASGCSTGDCALARERWRCGAIVERAQQRRWAHAAPTPWARGFRDPILRWASCTMSRIAFVGPAHASACASALPAAAGPRSQPHAGSTTGCKLRRLPARSPELPSSLRCRCRRPLLRLLTVLE